MAKKILIVEDEAPIAGAMQSKLLSEGFEVEIAKNGEEALESIKSNSYDLVLLDLVMPTLDGFGTLESMNSTGNMPKVIVSTNLSQPEDEERAKSLGAVDFLVKSNTSITDLVKVVKKHLG